MTDLEQEVVALRRQVAAYKTLVASLEARLAVYGKNMQRAHAAIATLDSEREANRILTGELEANATRRATQDSEGVR